MATSLTLGRLESNKNSWGGLKAIYFVGFLGTLKSGATLAATEEVTGFASAQSLLKYELKGSNNLDETNSNDRATGTSFYEQSGSVTLKKQALATRKELKLLTYERVHVITEDYNGLFKIFGFENGCEVAVDVSNGTAMGDLSGYTLNISGQETEPAHMVASSIIDDTTNTAVVVGT